MSYLSNKALDSSNIIFLNILAFRYYFPTYENDTLLCALSDSEDELTAENQKEEIPVISEDISSLKALKQSSILNQLLCEENSN